MVDLFKTQQVKTEIEADPSKLQDIIEASEYGICVTNKDGNFVAVNDQYTKVYGYSKEELVGNSFLIVVPEENREYLSYLHDRFIESKHEISRTWEVKRKDDSLISINVDARFTDAIEGEPHKLTFIEIQD